MPRRFSTEARIFGEQLTPRLKGSGIAFFSPTGMCLRERSSTASIVDGSKCAAGRKDSRLCAAEQPPSKLWWHGLTDTPEQHDRTKFICIQNQNKNKYKKKKKKNK